MVAIGGENRKRIQLGKRFYKMYGNDVLSAQTLEVSLSGVGSRNGAPSRKGCVVNGQITKASN